MSSRVRLSETLRRHVGRVARRFVALGVADLATFWLLREAYRLIINNAVLGTAVARVVRDILPSGYLNGWQFAAALLIGLVVTGNYGPGDSRRDVGRLCGGAALATGLTLWASLWTRGVAVVLPQMLITAVGVSFALIAERLWLNRFVGRLQLQRRAERLLFIGTPADCEEAKTSPAFTYPGEFRAAGELNVGTLLDSGSAAALQTVRHSISRLHVDTVVVCGGIPDTVLQTIVDAARMNGCRLQATSHTWDVAGVDPLLVWQHGEPVVELTTPSVRAPQLVLKRIVDILGALTGLVVLSPVLLVVATLVRLDSRGPVFFASERWGRGGRRIRIWKFRTMIDGAHDLLDSDPAMRRQFADNAKIAQDPRVTRVGGWLRRWSIDELPQLYNVLRGEMSLVGPRPKLPGEEGRYQALFEIVLSVPPGLTGLWQVSGRNSLSYEERIALDVDYVRRCSLWLDLRLLIQTLPVVVRGLGAH